MSEVLCRVCGFDGQSRRYHCRDCSRRYLPLREITPDLLDRAETAAEAAHDEDGMATDRGIAAAVLPVPVSSGLGSDQRRKR
jgi:hypothetical protein